MLSVRSACASNYTSCSKQGPGKCDICNDGYYLNVSKTCTGHNFICLVQIYLHRNTAPYVANTNQEAPWLR